MKKVWSQKDQVERVILGLGSALKFSGRYRQSSNHTEVLSLASQACSRMTELQKQKWAPDRMTNVKKNSLEFSSPYHFTDFGSVKPTMQSPQTFIDIPGLVELGNPVTITIAEKDAHGLEVWSTNPSITITVAYGKKKKRIALDPRLTLDGKW